MEPHIDKCPAFAHVLVVPRLRVQNANAISSPHTHGFPAMTAFLGLMWALERKTIAAGLDLQFNAVAVVVHRHQELTTDDTFVKRLRVTRNPVRRDGKSAAIVEEGRIHIELSLVFAVQSDSMEMANEATRRETVQQVKDIILQMRIAGGRLYRPLLRVCAVDHSRILLQPLILKRSKCVCCRDLHWLNVRTFWKSAINHWLSIIQKFHGWMPGYLCRALTGIGGKTKMGDRAAGKMTERTWAGWRPFLLVTVR